jgi:putative phosphoribosyl transferase
MCELARLREKVGAPYAAFTGRRAAGEQLAEWVTSEPEPGAEVVALPRGGVPIGGPVSDALEAPLSVVMTRKLPLPASPEAGFGAVSLDSEPVLNEDLVRRAGLDDERIDEVVEEVREELRRRRDQYGTHVRMEELHGRHVYLVDDGLASGFSMIAAASEVREQDPEKMTLAVPVSPVRSLERVEGFFDDAWCLIAQRGGSFAVASFYQSFPELSDAEVKGVLSAQKSVS